MKEDEFYIQAPLLFSKEEEPFLRRSSMSKSILVLFLLFYIKLHVSCAPMNARVLREQRPVSIGIPGASVRMGGGADIGFTVNPLSVVPLRMQATKNDGEDVAGDWKEDEGHRNVDSRFGLSPNVFMRFYPMETSGFLIDPSLSTLNLLSKLCCPKPRPIKKPEVSIG